MSSSSTPAELYQSGNLQEAIDAALAQAKKKPADTEVRGLLAELLCFAGDWERADKQLDTIGHQDPDAIMGLSLLRQLVRAEVTRKECFEQGRPPELVTDPDEQMKLHLEALVALRDGELQHAADLLGQAEEKRPAVKGKHGEDAFDDMRDLDDVTAGYFEVLTSTGKYFWIPAERVLSITFHPPKRPRDILWRQASMHVEDGPEGDVYLSSIYFQTAHESDEKLKLGRATDWLEGDDRPHQGIGQRMFLVGENAVSIMQMTELEFEVSSEAS